MKLLSTWERSDKVVRLTEQPDRAGVPGKRLLRLGPEMMPRAENSLLAEPVGPVVPFPPAAAAVRPAMLRPGKCVYETGFQNMSRGTAEKLIVKLEQSGDPSALLRPYYTPESPEDTTLVFESRFESGNLARATRVTEWEYDLELSFDTNTNGHTQWYPLAPSAVNCQRPPPCRNTRPGVYRRRISRSGGGEMREGAREGGGVLIVREKKTILAPRADDLQPNRNLAAGGACGRGGGQELVPQRGMPCVVRGMPCGKLISKNEF